MTGFDERAERAGVSDGGSTPPISTNLTVAPTSNEVQELLWN